VGFVLGVEGAKREENKDLGSLSFYPSLLVSGHFSGGEGYYFGTVGREIRVGGLVGAAGARGMWMRLGGCRTRNAHG